MLICLVVGHMHWSVMSKEENKHNTQGTTIFSSNSFFSLLK